MCTGSSPNSPSSAPWLDICLCVAHLIHSFLAGLDCTGPVNLQCLHVSEREREREKVTLSCLLTHTDSHLVLSFTVELMKSGKKPMGEDAVTWSFLRAATCPEVRSSCRMGTPSAPIIAHSGLPLLARGRKDDVSRGIGLPIDMRCQKSLRIGNIAVLIFFKKIFLSAKKFTPECLHLSSPATIDR